MDGIGCLNDGGGGDEGNAAGQQGSRAGGVRTKTRGRWW